MKRKHYFFIAVLIFFICIFAFRIGSRFLSPSQPSETQERLFDGIEYIRRVENDPRPMVIHIVKIKLITVGLFTSVTEPQDPNASLPLNAQKTSAFLEENHLQLAINADGFKPWISLGPIAYPYTGFPIRPNGFTASNSIQYGPSLGRYPTLFISENKRADMDNPIGSIFNAISGLDWIIYHGNIKDDLDDSLNPRTTVGIDLYGENMVIVVVDGRQPGYSEGASLKEIANILLEFNVFNAMNLDGGGSSTLVISDSNGNAKTLNSPIHQGIPGNERPVGNHFGIITKP